MKKAILTLAVILMAIPAFSQLNVKSKTPKAERLTSLRMGVIELKRSEALGYFMTMSTDNQFDKPGLFLLGETAEDAQSTVRDMISILDGGEESGTVSVKASPKVDCTLYVSKQLGVPVLWFKFDGCAGRQGLSKKELTKILESIK